MASGLVTALIGSVQASLSVLLTIGAGVVSAQYGLLDEQSAKSVSTLGVHLLLPALLATNIGSQLSVENGYKYLPIIVWAFVYNIVSILVGLSLRRLFKVPSWTTPAITFNNTISMPLLLVQSLGETSILEPLLGVNGETLPDALERTKSFFLVNSCIADSVTFGLGPMLLGQSSSQVGESMKRQRPFDDEVIIHQPNDGDDAEGVAPSPEDLADEEDEEQEEADVRANEEQTLLPQRFVGAATHKRHQAFRHVRRLWYHLPGPLKSVLSFAGNFVNPPLIGAAAGIIIGLTPALKRAFFNEAERGGFFSAWLTACVKNVGQVFPTLQVIVVGVKLRQSLYHMKKGEESGELPWLPTFCALTMRFLIWPAVSIPLIWALTTKAGILVLDPFLLFAMAVMPTGPPALKLAALADVSGSSEEEKMSIAKFLTLAYTLSPVMAFAVVGALKASQAAVA